MTVGLYIAGSSLVHRTPAWAKLAALAVGSVLLFQLSSIPQLLIAILVPIALVLVAGIPRRALVQQVRPAVPTLVALMVVHLILGTLETGVITIVRLATLMLAATIVTLTTKMSDLVLVVEILFRPTRHLGLNPAKVGLVIAMTIRFIPLLNERAQRIRDAQAARGAERPLFLVLIPLFIQTLQLGHALAEALDARGFDTAPDSSDK